MAWVICDTSTGRVVAAYSHEPPPAAAGHILFEIAGDAPADRDAQRWNGNAGAPALDAAPSGEIAAAVKAAANAEIDRQAEAARLRFITAGSGQAAVYLAKAAEAAALAVDGSPDPADYPLLSASIGIEAESLAAVAGIVLATRAAWLTVAAAIEAERLGAKAAVAALSDPPDPADIAAILAGLEWPAPGG